MNQRTLTCINMADISKAIDLCSYCGNSPPADTKLKICSACKACRYCSVECQRKAWPEHKKVCNGSINDVSIIMRKDINIIMNHRSIRDIIHTLAWHWKTFTGAYHIQCLVKNDGECIYMRMKRANGPAPNDRERDASIAIMYDTKRNNNIEDCYTMIVKLSRETARTLFEQRDKAVFDTININTPVGIIYYINDMRAVLIIDEDTGYDI